MGYSPGYFTKHGTILTANQSPIIVSLMLPFLPKYLDYPARVLLQGSNGPFGIESSPEG